MLCAGCGKESAPGSRFCGGCGAALASACLACGVGNPFGNNFCSECGALLAGEGERAPVADPPTARTPSDRVLTPRGRLEGERKQVTVLFADIKSSMELLSDRDPEEARKLLYPVVELMMDAVHRYEGTVNQVMGDGIMALFGAPVAHEDHAIRACWAALEMQQSAMRYSAELSRAGGIPVQIRVGLNSGEVVVGLLTSDIHSDYTAVGQATHLAARMEQLATPGTILVTGDLLRLVAGAIDVKPCGLVSVKGLAAPIEVFELIAVRSNRTGFADVALRGLTPFVGRGAELEALGRALEQARRGRGQVVALVGEPGVGKSRVVWELIIAPPAEGWRVIIASATSYGRRTVYLPVSDLLRACFGIQDRDDTSTIQDKVAARAQRLHPSPDQVIPPLLALLEAMPVDSPFQRLDPALRRRETLNAVTAQIVRESHGQPTLVVVENLHWIDVGSQNVLDALVEHLAAASIVLLVTYRPEYQHAWSGKTYYTQLPLGALPEPQADEFLEALLGRDDELRPLKRLLVAQSEGNPFFLEESVRTLVGNGTLLGARGAYRLARPVENVRVPATVQAVIAARIDRLPAAEKDLLQSASVIGKDVPGALLEAIADQPVERVRQGLAQLRAGEFIYETGFFPEVKYTFKHALTHEVAYGSLLRERRRTLHARIVQAVEQLYRDRLSDHVERLGHHAVLGEVWDKALRYLRQAGAKAFAHSAHKVAVGWFEQALGVLEHLPGAATGETAIDLRLDLRYALTPLGQFPRIYEILREAEQLALGLEDQARLGIVSSFLTNYFQFMGHLERAVEYGQRALDIATTRGDLGARVVATAYLSLTYQTLGDLPRAIDLARDNIARLGDGLELERFGMAILPSIYSRTALVRALADVGEFPEGIAVGAEGVRIGEQANHAYSLHFACLGLGTVYLRQGNWELATTLLERARDLCADAPAMLALVAGFLGSAYVLAGRIDEAFVLLEHAQEHAASLGLGPTVGHGLRLAARAEACLGAGQAERAREIGRQALDHFERLRARGYQAWALRLLAAGTALVPKLDEAEALYGRAFALASELCMRPLAAQCLLELGELQREAGRAEAARSTLARAVEMFGSMEVPFWSARAAHVAATVS